MSTESQVDQILFSWGERTLTGGRGVGPTASSIGSAQDLAWWEQRLLSANWAAAEVGGAAVQPALVYLHFDDRAAVLHKEVVTDLHGRAGAPLTHALLGHVSVLDARVALGLHDWPGWIRGDDVQTGLTSLEGEDLRRMAGEGYQALDKSARQLDPRLPASLFAALLSDPRGHFSVYPAEEPVQEPDGSRAEPALVAARLMCAVLGVLGDRVAQEWTFSTCEPEEPTGAGRPRIVFLSQPLQFSMQVPTGNRVRIGEPGWFGSRPDPEGASNLQAFGDVLADLYSTQGPDALRDLRPRNRLSTAAEALAWAAQAQFAPGVLADFGYLVKALGHGPTNPAVIEEVRSRLASGLDTISAARLHELVPLWAPEAEVAIRYPDIAEAIWAEAAWRYLTASRPPDERTVLAMAVPAATWLDQLTRYRHARGTGALREAAYHVLPVVTQDLETEFVEAVAELPVEELLSLAVDGAADRPTLSVRLLAFATGKILTPSERVTCRELLERTGYLVSTVERCHPGDPEGETRLFARLLHLIVGPDLERPEEFDRILRQVAEIRCAPLLHALGTCVAGDLRHRVLARVGNLWFADCGLAELSTGTTSPPTASQSLVQVSSAEVIRAAAVSRQEGAVPRRDAADSPAHGSRGRLGKPRKILIVGVAVIIVVLLLVAALVFLGGSSA
jgi:hypothetical protein